MPEKQRMKLWVMIWGAFGRRVIVYLKEKGIEDDFEVIDCDISTGMMTAPGKPPGLSPILQVGPNEFITESVAIMEYLEDIYPLPNLRGPTPYEVARTRSFVQLISESTAVMGLYGHNASAMFKSVGPQDEGAARFALVFGHKVLNYLERQASDTGPLLGTDQTKLTIADIMLMVQFQYVDYFYGISLWKNHPRLASFWEAVQNRPSLQGFEQLVPANLKEFARVLSVVWDDIPAHEKALSVDKWADQKTET